MNQLKNLFVSMVAMAFLVVASTTAFAQSSAALGPELDEDSNYYAVLHTSLGRIVLDLFQEESPITVRNFVNLAEGTKDFIDPRDRQRKSGHYYDSVIFHRVIPGFMIQGGDREGTGRGGPGYAIPDEFASGLRFDRPYLLAMANAGPNTGGSQFFITTGDSRPAHLNNRHTIFGIVVEGGRVVDAIAGVPRGANDRPNEEVVIRHAQIIRVPSDASEDAWKEHVLDIPRDRPYEAPVVEVAEEEEEEAAEEEAEVESSEEASEPDDTE